MYYPNEKYFHAITISNTYVPATTTNVTITLLQGNFNTDIQTLNGTYSPLSTGADIRFCSDAALSIPIPFDIVNFSPNATPANARIEINVQIPSLSSSAPTTIYVQWGDTTLSLLGRTNTYGRDNTYKSGFKLWCPMRDDPDTSHVHDRTVNDLTGTKRTAGDPAQLVDAGVLNEAEVFTATNPSYIDFPSIATGTQFTVFCPFYYTGTATHNWNRIVSNKNAYNDANGFEISLLQNSTTGVQIGGASASQWNNATYFTNITTDGWENFAVKFNGTEVDLFKIAVKTTGANVITSVANCTNTITIGENAAHNETGFQGRIDPIIIYVGVLTDAEIQIMQNNQRIPTTFVSTVGTTKLGPYWTSDYIVSKKRRYRKR